MEFYNWLLAQRDRKDVVGAFSRALADVDVSRLKRPQTGRRKKDDHKKWADIVIRRNNPTLIDAFNLAWQEYARSKQEAKIATS